MASREMTEDCFCLQNFNVDCYSLIAIHYVVKFDLYLSNFGHNDILEGKRLELTCLVFMVLYLIITFDSV